MNVWVIYPETLLFRCILWRISHRSVCQYMLLNLNYNDISSTRVNLEAHVNDQNEAHVNDSGTLHMNHAINKVCP